MHVLERSLSKAVLVRDVVNAVDDVERVHTCGIDIHGDGGSLGGVLDELEVEVSATRGGRGLRALEGDGVVTTVPK